MVMSIKTCSEHVALVHLRHSVNYLKEKFIDMSSQFYDANSTEYNKSLSQFHDANQQKITKKQ